MAARAGDLDRPGPAAEQVAPLGLWLRGPLRLADAVRCAVGIVGSRAATSYGLHVAGELGFQLAEQQWAVVSGAAYGIDAAARAFPQL